MVWSKLKWFSPSENWGDPSKVDPTLLLLLDEIRDVIGWPIVIHCAYETSGHSPNSYHYLGRAVDFHFKSSVPFYEQVERLLRILDQIKLEISYYVIYKPSRSLLPISDFVGLGIYPAWNNPGFHLDIRSSKTPARWGWKGDYEILPHGRKKKKYVSFNEALEYARQKGI